MGRVIRKTNFVPLERLKARLRRFRLYRVLRFARHFATDSVFRGDHLRLLRPPRGQFQYRSFTGENRYPRVFGFLREQLAEVREPRLLSFGCATGEEVFSLRRYFPDAIIRGVDIDAHNVARCEERRRRIDDPKIQFAQQASVGTTETGCYDAVLCMAVFQHSALKEPRIRSCESYIRFADFKSTLAGIARATKPGGFLAIRHADFRFSDTACSLDFEAVLRIEPHGAPHPRFDRNNRRLPDEHDAEVVFRKRFAVGAINPNFTG